MDAPPPMENAGAFVTVTRHLQSLGGRVPEIYAVDDEEGFVLLEDLGDHTFTRLLLEGSDETMLYRQAIDALCQIHHHKNATCIALPAYDTRLALAEASLLLNWYIPARRNRPIETTARDQFQRIWIQMLGALKPLEPTLVLRDFHVDNLMLIDGNCALLDYQDAVIGSPAYDLISLIEDARRDLSTTLAATIFEWYLEQNHHIDQHQLHQHCIVWGAQRHCKVAGIFVRLWLRDGKDVYLQHLSRVLALLKRNLNEPVLLPLQHWLHEYLGEIDHIAFTTPAEQLARHCNT